MNLILSPNDPIEFFQNRGGGKATNLAKISQKNFPVPPWICVGAEVFDRFIQENNLESALVVDGEPLAESERIHSKITSAPFSASLGEILKSELEKAGLLTPFVAVRSSGIDEDSSEHSFAGQFSSFLFQKGFDQICESIKACWASGFSERALSYRLERGITLHNIRVGVVIQKMVNATSAGVAFSRHPIKVLDRDHVLISSVWGLGEGLVSGELDSDDFEAHRETQNIISKIADKKEKMSQLSSGGIEKVGLEATLQGKSSLSDSQVLKIAGLACRLEESLGSPQDIEWCLEGNEIFLVQTRPITSLPPDAFYDPTIVGKQPILWDNSNIIESYSGVTSPLTFSFASRAYNQVYIQFCELMGVPQELVDKQAKVFRNMLALIRGRIYYNLVNWYQLVLMLPGSSSNKGFMETMMGVKDQVRPELKEIFDFVKEPPKYSLFSKIVLSVRTLNRFLKIDSIIAEFQNRFNKCYDVARKKNFNAMSLQELSDYFFYLDEELLKQWKAPIINDYLCMVFFGLLKKLTSEWVVKDSSKADSLQNDLLCGQGDLDSTEPTKCLMRIAARLDQDVILKKKALESTPEELWSFIKGEGKETFLAKDLADFLDRYGFRCINELKLEEPDLHDDPTFVISSVVSYVKTQSYRIEHMEAREREIRIAAEKVADEALSGVKKIVYRWILKQARRAVRNRENLRFARTKIFGVSRHLFRAMGEKLTQLGFLETRQDVFYLTVEEIVAFIEGRAVSLELKQIVAIRKAEYATFDKTVAPPDRMVTMGALGAAARFPSVMAEGDLLRNLLVSDDPDVLMGTPCCPGIIEGVVRVVHSAKDAQGIDGEILVTGRTDPGWVPIYPSCSGLLIERGSLLSHSAVVARELGLPTIVGVNGGLMTRLKTGDRVRVDAGKGEIRILR